MEYNVKKRQIKLNKILNELDKFTIDFVKVLEKHSEYVIVSGYVSILLGRSRASEDVDLLIPQMSFPNFLKLFDDLISRGYECANTSDPNEAFEMWGEHAIRFYKENPLPNIEFKKITNEIQKKALAEKISVIIRENKLFISPLELQIAYKLSIMSKGSIEEISSDKDFEDAKHLYDIFLEELNREELLKFMRLFEVEDKMELLER